MTAEFIVNNNGSLDSIIIEGPVFYKPGEPMQIRVEVYTRHSVMRRHLTRGPENEDYLLIHAVCGGDFNEELTVHYGNGGDFVTNPCKYAREVGGSIISQPSDDMTLRLVVGGIMERLGGITISIDELINSENCGKKY